MISRDAATFAAALLIEAIIVITLVLTGVAIGVNPGFMPLLVVGLLAYSGLRIITSVLWGRANDHDA